MFLCVVTLKIRSRSQSPNQGFSMSEYCIIANFGQNPVICSGYIVPYIFKVHANINAETDASKIYVHSTLFVLGVYELPYSLFSIRGTFSRKEDTKHIISGKTCTFYASFIP